MYRHIVCAVLVLLGTALLTGCGQKGPLFLPKPNVAAPAPGVTAPAQPAPATTASAAGSAAGSG